MSDLAQDVRFAARGLRRQPAFLIAVLLTLALGIGANTAIFSVVDAILLRPLPYADPDRLVTIWPEGAVPPGIFDIVEREARSYAGLAAHTAGSEVSLTGGGDPLRVTAVQVTGGLFEVLGVRASIGRTFVRGDNAPGRERIALLGHALWRQRYGGDPRIVGKAVIVDGIARTVVGVMPKDFRFPTGDAQLWTPVAFDPGNRVSYWWMTYMYLVGRLRDGVSTAEARAEAAVVFDRARAAFPMRMPDAWGTDVDVVRLRDRIVGGARQTLIVLLGAVGLVLLIACVNVANLFLARSASRQRELAIRAAMGAGRARIARQLITESLLLALLGAAAGLLLAFWALHVLVALLPPGTPRAEEIGIHGRVLAFTLLLAVLTGLAFGLAPALRASRPNLRSALASGITSLGGGPARSRLAEILVVAEVALAVVLVAGAGLLIKSFWLLRQVDPGFRTEHVIAAEVPLPSFPSDSVARARVFFADVLARVHALPRVRAAAVASVLPFGGGASTGPIEVESHPTPPGGVPPSVEMTTVSPEYFRAMGIPLLAGRGFSDSDREGSPGAVLVDAVAARTLWPGEDAVGQRVRYVWRKDWMTVVGVTGAVKRDSLSTPEKPSVYFPVEQGSFLGTMRLVVRADADAGALAPALRAAVAGADRNVPLSDIRALGEIVSASAARPRFTMLLLALFAGVALSLGAVGIYGVIAFAVARRTREIGVRMALGARRGDVLRMVLWEGAVLVAVGGAVGLAGALAAGRLLAGLLYGVAPGDPAVLVAVPVLLAAVALAACFVPARRAAHVDPLIAMRAE